MAQWSAAEKADAQRKGVSLPSSRPKGGLAALPKYREVAGYKPLQGGGGAQQQQKSLASGMKAAGGISNPLKPQGTTPGQSMSTAQRTELVKGSANPFDDRVAGIAYRPQGDDKYASEKVGMDKPQSEKEWQQYGSDAVNKDLKWQFEQGGTGYGDYTSFLKAHYDEFGQFENRLRKPEPVKAPRRAPGPAATEAAPPPKAPTEDIDPGERDEITPPASGLEETIEKPTITPPLDYRNPEQNAPGSGYGEFKDRGSYLTLSEEREKRRRSYLTRAG